MKLRILPVLAAVMLLAHAPAWADPNTPGGGGGSGGGGNVNLTGINGVTPSVGAGLSGTGALRATTAQDPTTIAGSAPGTAGSPSANVLSVQGVSGGTAIPVTGTFSATIGGFAPASVGTPISATTGGATGTLPAGTTVVATNVGTTNAAYCALGGASSTAQQYIAPNGGWFAFTVGVATQLTCVTSTSTTTVNMVGGSGLATGTGGGSGGGGSSGNVTIVNPLGANSIAASVAVTPATSSVWPASQSGTWTVQPGNTANTTAWLVTGTGGTFPITAASLPLPTGAATSANQPTNSTQGATTSGQTGNLVMGATTTAAPTYTTAQTNPISLDTSGNTRVADASVVAAITAAAPSLPLSTTAAGTTDTPISSASITVQDTGSTSTSSANSQAIVTGTPTAGSVATFALANGYAAARFQVTGTWTGTLTAEGSVDGGTTWTAIGVHQNGTSYSSSSFTGNFEGVAPISGFTNIRVRATAAMTGTATVASVQTVNPGSIYIGNTGSFGAGQTGAGVGAFALYTGMNVGGNLTGLTGTANGLKIDGSAVTQPVSIASVSDPCSFQAKTNVAISTASGTTALVTGVSGKKVYICSLALIAPSAVSVSIAEGSSATCGTSSQAAIIGVATSGTAANGMPLAANGGLTLGNGGGTVAQSATAANYVCLFQSGTAQLAGNLTFVQQ